MRRSFVAGSVGALAGLLLSSMALAQDGGDGGGWRSLFDGESLAGWRVSEAAAQSWSVIDGVIDGDPRSTLDGERDLWTEESFGDFVLYVEWRLTDAPTMEDRPIILPTGEEQQDADGNVVTERIPNADSGIYLRGHIDAQVNIWNWSVGSGEVWGYRTDPDMPAEVRAGATPSVRADNPVGEWNTFVITMIGDRLSVFLNGQVVINDAQLPDVAESGPIALQYHGGYDENTGEYRPASSLVQFRNIHILELD
jgi:hypothetical protein